MILVSYGGDKDHVRGQGRGVRGQVLGFVLGGGWNVGVWLQWSDGGLGGWEKRLGSVFD